MSVEEKITAAMDGASLPGSVSIVIDDKTLSFTPEGKPDDSVDPDCTLILSEELLRGIVGGDTDPMGAYFSGDLSIKGDMAVAMALSSILKG